MSNDVKDLTQVAPGVALEPFAPTQQLLEPESVIRYRVRPNRFWSRLALLMVRLLQGVVVAGVCLLIPDITAIPFHNWKNPVVVFLLICYIGKTLVDTFFYDHYQA